MAIGHGFNDILMMNSADIGIEIAKHSKNKRDIEINMMLGDIVLTNLRQVKQLMMNQTGIYFERFKHFIEFTYFKSFLYGYSLFFFAFFTQFSSNCFYELVLSFFFLPKGFLPKVVSDFCVTHKRNICCFFFNLTKVLLQCVSGIWTSLTWSWWFGFGLKPNFTASIAASNS